jgi:hypothetical protein
MSLYACPYIHRYEHMYLFYIYIAVVYIESSYVYKSIRMHIYKRTNIYTHKCTSICKFYISLYTYIYVYIYIYIYIYTY